jgi:hypothetical protein
MKNFRYNNYKRSQALLFVFFLLLIVSILVGALAVMWKAEIGMRNFERESMIAFYLAQAAIERGKIEVLYGYWAPGVYVISNQNDLDLSGDNYQFIYDIEITNNGGTSRTIKGTGRVLDLSGNEIARREIEVIVNGIEDNLPPYGVDDDLSGREQRWSWREL